MVVNEFENSKQYRLQQIMHTLESVHGVRLDFDSQSYEDIKTLGESCEIVKNSIVKESAFNTAMQNPEYTKNMLIIEAVRIYLSEVAPKRMSKKKAVKESALEEGPRGRGRGASHDWAQNKMSQASRRGDAGWTKDYRKPGETSKAELQAELDALKKEFLDKGGRIKAAEAIDPGKMVKLADFGRKMMEYSQSQSSTDDKELRVLNAISQVGDKLTQLGTPFGPTSLTDLDKRVIEVARRRMSAQGVTETVPGQDLKLQPGMLKVKKDNGPEEVIDAKDLANKQRQGYQPVAEDKELAALYHRYGIDEATDQDEDGNNDFADVMIARMMKSGMSKQAAIAKTKDKPYNKESMMEAATKELHKLTKRKKELEDKMDKIIAQGGKLSRTDPLRSEYEKVVSDIKKAKSGKLEEAEKWTVGNHKGTVSSSSTIQGKDVHITWDDKKNVYVGWVGNKKVGEDRSKTVIKKLIKDSFKKPLKEAAHMESHDDYQASMARSELYRNTKYAMDMMKMIGPDDEVKPWIAANLTKAAGILDKVYHYMDYYMTFEQPKEEPMVAVDEDIDQVEGDPGSIARQNLMMIMEYSTKLFRMIKPGDKLEGWVAMKLTTASEAISCSKHHLDYVQFEKHAGDFEPEVTEVPVEEKKTVKEATVANILMSAMLNEEQDLAQAETLLAAKAMSDELQGMAEKLAKMSVEDLMPLVDTMKEQFGQDAANGFNEVIKAGIEAALNATTEAKETADNAILSMQQGQVPGVTADIETVGEPAELPADEEGEPDEFAGTTAAAGPEEEPLGRAKKSDEEEAPEELEEGKKCVKEKWDTKMKTAKKDIGKWEGYTIADLKARKKKLMDKEKRSAAEQKEVDQLNFAIRAKQKNSWGKIKESTVTELKDATKQSYIDKAKQEVDDLKSKGWTKKMDPKKGSKAELAREKVNKRVAGMTKAAMTMKEETLNEVAPPGKKAEDFIKKNKEKFKKQYGKRWQEVLYATAWKQFGPKKESYVKAVAMLESAQAKKTALNNAFAAHKKQFNKMVNEGQTIDAMNTGYGLQGQAILDQIAETNAMITKLQKMIQSEVKAGVRDLIVAEETNAKIAKLAEAKNRAPYGVMFVNSENEKAQKFFESDDLRKYWIDLNNDSITSCKLINPRDFDQRIANLGKKG